MNTDALKTALMDKKQAIIDLIIEYFARRLKDQVIEVCITRTRNSCLIKSSDIAVWSEAYAVEYETKDLASNIAGSCLNV